MKYVTALLLLLFTSTMVMGQNLNQFDADGLRHGNWKKNFDNTKVVRYEGQFDHGKEVGTFKFYKNIGGKAIVTATKVFNLVDNIAEVTFLASTGQKISEGKMKGRDYIGEWVIYHKKSTQVMTREFYNTKGQLEGPRYVYYLNGQIAEQTNYLSGLLHGECKWFSEKGTIMKSINYKGGKFEGAFKTFDKEGVLTREGNYKNDIKCCIWKRYKNGKLVEEKDLDKNNK